MEFTSFLFGQFTTAEIVKLPDGKLVNPTLPYSHLFNKRGGWNKRGGGSKFAKSLNVEVGINAENGILWEKLMHNSNNRGVEGGKNLRNQ